MGIAVPGCGFYVLLRSFHPAFDSNLHRKLMAKLEKEEEIIRYFQIGSKWQLIMLIWQSYPYNIEVDA